MREGGTMIFFFREWKICLIRSSFSAVVVLSWRQVVLLGLGTANLLGVAVIAGMGLLLVVAAGLCVVVVVWLLGVVALMTSLMTSLVASLLVLWLLLGSELCLEGEDALTFGFDFSGDFLLQFDLSVEWKLIGFVWDKSVWQFKVAWINLYDDCSGFISNLKNLEFFKKIKLFSKFFQATTLPQIPKLTRSIQLAIRLVLANELLLVGNLQRRLCMRLRSVGRLVRCTSTIRWRLALGSLGTELLGCSSNLLLGPWFRFRSSTRSGSDHRPYVARSRLRKRLKVSLNACTIPTHVCHRFDTSCKIS